MFSNLKMNNYFSHLFKNTIDLVEKSSIYKTFQKKKSYMLLNTFYFNTFKRHFNLNIKRKNNRFYSKRKYIYIYSNINVSYIFYIEQSA